MKRSRLQRRSGADIIDHQHIDLLLCDVMMPKMDGFALTQAIRDGGSMMPILMLTLRPCPRTSTPAFWWVRMTT